MHAHSLLFCNCNNACALRLSQSVYISNKDIWFTCRMMLASVLLVCAGVTVATVTDKVVINNMMGLAVGIAATFVTALYQVRANAACGVVCVCVCVLACVATKFSPLCTR